MAKHFQTDDGGRFALALVGDRVVYRHLAGPCPRPGHMSCALGLWPELLSAANAAARQRQNPWSVEVRKSPYGAMNYMLRECRDLSTGDFPVRATVHVSMYGKLNRPFAVWLGDLAPLFWSIFLNHPAAEGQWVREVPVYQPAGGMWQNEPLAFEVDGEGTLWVLLAEDDRDNMPAALARLATLDTES